MLTADTLRALARLSVTDPQQGGRDVLALDPPAEVRWMALVAAVTAGVVLAFLMPVLSGQSAQMPPPVAVAGFVIGGSALTALAMTVVGRMFGGRGDFAGAILLVAWLQWLLVGLQMVQVVALLVLPFLAELITLLAFVLYFWLLTGFVQALHGFASRGMVLLGTVGTMFALAMALSLVLLILGFDPRGVTDA